MEKIVVLVVDMQARFLREISKKDIRKILKANIQVIEELCIKKEFPLVTLEFAGCGDTARTLERRIEKVPKHRRKLFLKTKWDGFENEDFAEYIDQIGAKTLIIMGLYADRCVKATAESAVRLEYKIITAGSLIIGTIFDNGKSAKWYKKNGDR